MEDNSFEWEQFNQLDFEKHFSVHNAHIVEDQDTEDKEYAAPTTTVCSQNEDEIDFKYKKDAVEYWTSGKTGKLSITSVKHRFRKVTSERQLRRWMDQVRKGGSRKDKLLRISDHTLQNFIEAMDKQLIVHDVDLQRWALNAKRMVNLKGFVASSSWVWKFKRMHGIVSRKVTKFVTKHEIYSRNVESVQCEVFINEVKSRLTANGPENVFNSDQSGFNLEHHSGRTLAYRGSKKVESVVQSVSSTTQSYTIQPTISAAGKLLSPLLIVLKEVGGEFGLRVQETMFRPKNVFILASTSGKLTSAHLKTWLKDVFFPNVGSSSVLLLDSWGGQCSKTVSEATPHDKELKHLIIPKGTTGRIQPLDVYGFRVWKNFVKRFSDIVILYDYNVNLHLRNNIIKLQSLTHNQFSSPRFTDLFKYAWFKSGYIENRPPHFDNPVDFCFGANSAPICDICGNAAIITCAWCKKSFCFQNFFTEYHFCETYVP
ncbi:uncharacterized protein LOC117611505 [Osmia lignaria lignaria]|uniref:uncharacterized protein LOC117611505 n=1 Tax=Osmia lignaria lignaria TaxID=1437193 RepID=UPI00402BDB72